MRHYHVPATGQPAADAEFLAGQDCVLIATDHSAFDYELVVRQAPLVIDTRNATARVSGERAHVRRA